MRFNVVTAVVKMCMLLQISVLAHVLRFVHVYAEPLPMLWQQTSFPSTFMLSLFLCLLATETYALRILTNYSINHNWMPLLLNFSLSATKLEFWMWHFKCVRHSQPLEHSINWSKYMEIACLRIIRASSVRNWQVTTFSFRASFLVKSTTTTTKPF